MMRIQIFKSYWDEMANKVFATQAFLVRSESELAQKIKDVEAGILFLVVVVPSSDTSALNAENIIEKETVVVYAMQKVDRANQNDADMLNSMVYTQDCITNIKSNIYNDATNCNSNYHQYMSRIDFNRLRTDPEYNYFGCDGYSLSLTITSPGF